MNHIRRQLIHTSSHDPTIPLPTTPPHSFTPAQPEDDGVYNTPQSSQDTIPYQDVETEAELIIMEDDVEHLRSSGSDEAQPYDSGFVNFEGDYFVLLGHKSAAPDFKSYDSSVSILRRMERKRRRQNQ